MNALRKLRPANLWCLNRLVKTATWQNKTFLKFSTEDDQPVALRSKKYKGKDSVVSF